MAGRMVESEPWLHTDAQPPQDLWLKRWLVLCFGPRLIPKDAAPERHCEHFSLLNRKRLVVALLVALALVVMGLLLLWNYKCIMVWHLCREDGDYPALPTFGKG